MRAWTIVLGAVIAAAATQATAQAPDGAKLFANQCKFCHGAASTPAGPALNGVAGARTASRPGFKYSPALSAKGGTWTDAALDQFLTSPSAYAPGSRMVVKVASPDNRAALIAYLKTLK